MIIAMRVEDVTFNTFMGSENKNCAQHEIYLRAMGGRIAVRPEREISHRKGMKSGSVGAPPFSSPNWSRD